MTSRYRLFRRARQSREAVNGGTGLAQKIETDVALAHVGVVTFLILDACFRSDGTPYSRKNFDWKDSNLPASQLSWLETELSKARGPVIVLAHQRLDLDKAHAVQNAPAVRSLLEKSGKVLAVFQGHSHKNDYQQIAGIHYTTLVAMVEGSGAENNGYTMLDVLADSSLRLQGFRKQVERALKKA